uniref:PDZ domain-containing protein n=1 Tax=Parastrongyloides trichosuri TaxID=131310 RepID=A0A0N4Z4U3_PARTI
MWRPLIYSGGSYITTNSTIDETFNGMTLLFKTFIIIYGIIFVVIVVLISIVICRIDCHIHWKRFTRGMEFETVELTANERGVEIVVALVTVNFSMSAEKTSGEQVKDACAPVSELVVSIPMEEGDPLGATPNERLIIVKIQPGTLAEGNLHIGDHIIALNGTKLKDHNHFYHLLRFAPPMANITVIRDDKKSQDMLAKITIPHERERNIMRREGYIYQLAILNLEMGRKLGLGIRHFQNRVLVSKTDPGSIAHDQLKVGDHICDVEGMPVTDKDVCRKLLIAQLQENRKVTLVIERPDCAEAKEWARKALETPVLEPPSVRMNDDVKAIAMRERAKIKSYTIPQKKLLTRTPSSNSRCISFEENVVEHQIISDNEGRQLRRVRK